MKQLITLSLALCFVLFISIFADKKPLKPIPTEIKIPGFYFTGLKEAIKQHPNTRRAYPSKKLWGYIK